MIAVSAIDKQCGSRAAGKRVKAMEIAVQEMIAKVLKNTDENGEIQIDPASGEFESVSVADLIADVMGSVAEDEILKADWKDIDEWEDLTGEVDWIEPGHGEVLLPSDFLRLMEFRMSDWKKSVTTPVSLDSGVYSLRFNPGINRRMIRKAPMVAVSGGSGSGRLEFIGSYDPGAYIQRAGYIPKPFSEDSDTLRIPRSLLGRITDAITAKVRRITLGG